MNNASDLTVIGPTPSLDIADKLINDLLTALDNEGKVLSAVYDQLKKLAAEFASKTVAEVLASLVGILVDGVLSSVQVVVDAVLDVLYDLASEALELLDTKIHIPVISDIVNAIGIPDISFLDLFTWITAVAHTVIYKIATGTAPFPDGPVTSAMINASNWDALVTIFQPPLQPSPIIVNARASGTNGSVKPVLRATATAAADAGPLPDSARRSVHVAGHATSAFILFVGCFVNGFEAELPSADNPWGTMSAVMGVIAAASQGAANALVPKDPVEDEAVGILGKITTAATITSKLVFSGPAQRKFGAAGSSFSALAVNDGRATGAVVNSLLIIPALGCSCAHFYELSMKKEDSTRSASIIEEVSNMTSYVSRISYCVAVNDPEEITKNIAIGVMTVANIISSGLQTAVAVID
jgi:hypothetical protein